MRPEISDLIRRTIYPQLKDHVSVTQYPPVKGMVHDVFFLDHDHAEGGVNDDGQGKSKFNTWEVEYCLALARHLMLQVSN